MPSLVKGQSQPAYTTTDVSSKPDLTSTTRINPARQASTTGRMVPPRTPPVQPTTAKTVRPDTPKRAYTPEEEAFVQKFMNDLGSIKNTTVNPDERIQKSDELLKKLFNDPNGIDKMENNDNQADDDDNSNTEVDVTDENNYIRRTPPGRTVPSPK